MKIMNFKRHLFFVATVFSLFSCTTKEEKVREYVEQNVVTQAEEYLICQAIINYAKTDAQIVFTNKINYYANNPYYDYSYSERYIGSQLMTLALETGQVKKKFDERWSELSKLYILIYHMKATSNTNYIRLIVP